MSTTCYINAPLGRLSVCADLANQRKHAILTRRPHRRKDTGPTKANVNVNVPPVGGSGTIQYSWEIRSGNESYDALDLANSCVEEWRNCFVCAVSCSATPYSEVSASARWVNEREYTADVAIADEAWQLTYANLGGLGPLTAQVVLVGDPARLPRSGRVTPAAGVTGPPARNGLRRRRCWPRIPMLLPVCGFRTPGG